MNPSSLLKKFKNILSELSEDGIQSLGDGDNSHPLSHLSGIGEDVREYLKSLKEGDRVIECESSSTFFNREGTVYIHENLGPCVRWDVLPGETSQLVTGVTWGSRRIQDIATKNP